MGKLGYSGQLLRELVAFAKENKVYWIVPLVLTLGILTLLIFGGQGASPFIYTLF